MRLSHIPSLLLKNSSDPVTLDSKTNKANVGCVILLLIWTKPKINWFLVKTANAYRAKVRYRARKCDAIVWTVKLLHSYVEGIRFTTCIKNNSLKWILILTNIKCQLARGHLELLEFEFSVLHRAWIKCQSADARARLRTLIEDMEALDSYIPFLAINTQDESSSGIPVKPTSSDK